MQANQTNIRTQKVIASFIVILSVVIVTLGVQSLAAKQQSRSAESENAAISSRPLKLPDSMPSNISSTSNGINFKDGNYLASNQYITPGGQEYISLSLTVQNGTVTDSTVQNQSNNRDSQEYQASFSETYKTYVVGKKLSDINVLGISGSSLTEKGFNAALTQIKTQAQAN